MAIDNEVDGMQDWEVWKGGEKQKVKGEIVCTTFY